MANQSLTQEDSPEFRKSHPTQIEDLRGQVGAVSEKIASGEALLRVVAYPWGVEFDVIDAEGPR